MYFWCTFIIIIIVFFLLLFRKINLDFFPARRERK